MRNVVELSDHSVQQLWSSKSILSLELRTKVTENDNGWHIRPDQDRSHQQLKVGQPFGIAINQSITSAHISLQLLRWATTYFGSELSNSKMTKSVLSGKWCPEQYAKYAESVFLVAPFVSSEAGCGKTLFHHSKNLEG